LPSSFVPSNTSPESLTLAILLILAVALHPTITSSALERPPFYTHSHDFLTYTILRRTPTAKDSTAVQDKHRYSNITRSTPTERDSNSYEKT